MPCVSDMSALFTSQHLALKEEQTRVLVFGQDAVGRLACVARHVLAYENQVGIKSL